MNTFLEIAKYFVFDLFNDPRSLMEKNRQLMSNSPYVIDQDFLEEYFENKGAKWTGYKVYDGSIKQFLSYENLRFYENKDLLRNISEIKNDLINTLDLGGDFDANRLKFTSVPKGVFDFGMASKGLYRQIEYYDENAKKVINDKLVRSKIINSQKQFYYNTPKGQNVLRKQQKGTNDVVLNCKKSEVIYNEEIDMYLPYIDGKIYNGCGALNSKGEPSKLQYATSIKKVYLYRESLGGGINDYVELYIPTSIAYNLSPENTLAKNLPCLIVAEILETAGVKTRIYGLNTSRIAVSNGGICQAFVVKDFGENLDINKISAFTSDIRFFRTQQVYQSAMRVGMKNNYTDSWLRKTSKKGMNYVVDYKNELFSPLFNSYKNWVFNNKESLKYSTKIQNQNLMIVGGLKGSQKLNFTTNKDQTYGQIQNEVYRMLDYIGLMTTKNLRGFVQKVKTRMSEKGLRDQFIKEYLLENLEKNTQIVFPLPQPEYKIFATSKTVAKTTRQKVDEIIDAINEIL